MDFDFDMLLLETEEGMDKALENYEANLSKINVGRANPQILDFIRVEYYGSLTPIKEMASITVPEPRQLLIKPYDISTNKEIANTINKSSLGFRAVDEGDKTRITLPELTTERRKEMVKSLAHYTEQARVLIRQVRQDANKMIKAQEALPEDDEKRYLDSIQKLTDKFNEKIEVLTQAKEKDLMTI